MDEAERNASDEYRLNFIGEVPKRTGSRKAGDEGTSVVIPAPDPPQAAAFRQVAEEIARQVSIEATQPDSVTLPRANQVYFAEADFRAASHWVILAATSSFTSASIATIAFPYLSYES